MITGNLSETLAVISLLLLYFLPIICKSWDVDKFGFRSTIRLWLERVDENTITIEIISVAIEVAHWALVIVDVFEVVDTHAISCSQLVVGSVASDWEIDVKHPFFSVNVGSLGIDETFLVLCLWRQYGSVLQEDSAAHGFPEFEVWSHHWEEKTLVLNRCEAWIRRVVLFDLRLSKAKNNRDRLHEFGNHHTCYGIQLVTLL